MAEKTVSLSKSARFFSKSKSSFMVPTEGLKQSSSLWRSLSARTGVRLPHSENVRDLRRIAFNVTVVYMARDIMILMQAISITRAIGGVGPEMATDRWGRVGG